MKVLINLLPPSYGYKVEALGNSKVLVFVYRTTQYEIADDHGLEYSPMCKPPISLIYHLGDTSFPASSAEWNTLFHKLVICEAVSAVPSENDEWPG